MASAVMLSSPVIAQQSVASPSRMAPAALPALPVRGHTW